MEAQLVQAEVWGLFATSWPMNDQKSEKKSQVEQGCTSLWVID